MHLKKLVFPGLGLLIYKGVIIILFNYILTTMTGTIALMLELPILDKIHKYLENCETALISFSLTISKLAFPGREVQARKRNRLWYY